MLLDLQHYKWIAKFLVTILELKIQNAELIEEVLK